ncbi:hypothetical protein [Flavobacterium silvaticum]|uniref:DNA primase n=1 Tax=Flavobacterium silvaticum TaxID=1852020 RepID=A0A972JE66_9FLAO|nr:hypothetical protein [Flavobacterium silvaticum]NMH26534.1 hypothetical protein [Flavobacterium silvaticum]
MQHLITQLEALKPSAKISTVQLPDGHTLNDMWVNYGREAITQLLGEVQLSKPEAEKLETVNDFKMGYKGKAAQYFVVGNIPSDMASMRIALHVVDYQTQRKQRIKVDLYDFTSIQFQCRELSDKFGFGYNLLEGDMMQLTELLETHREQLFFEQNTTMTQKYSEKELTPRAGEKAVAFLTEPNLIQNIDGLLEQSGIVGEQVNRQLLFIIASSYKNSNPLHAILQASSASGKSHLINSIAECVPQEDLKNNTSFSSKSLYYQKEKELMNKLMVIQDFDGMDEQAQFAFRELQSNRSLMRDSAEKNKVGKINATQKMVVAHFSSLAATTNLEIYTDNATRSIMLGVDESETQTLRIIQRQNQKRAGLVSSENEQAAKQLLRNCMRVLKPYAVVNYFADKLTLPIEAKSLRRLNEQFQDFICQITILHQYQRKKDPQGRLIATKEDIRAAVELFFSTIVVKADELDASTRQFFDQLKTYIKKQDTGTTYKFTQREVRQDLRLGKTTVFKFMTLLQQLEYIQAVEGSANRGFKYVVSHWDNLEKLKGRIKEDLNKQLDAL